MTLTYRPYTSIKGHWIWDTTGKVGCAEGEAVITDLSSAVSPQWAVIGISIIRCGGSTQAENESIVTPSTTKETNVATISIAISTSAVLITVCPDLQPVVS